MKLENIQIGTKLELEMHDESDKNVKVRLVSQLEDCMDNKTATIAAPVYCGELYSIHIGSIMDIFFLREDKLYRFKANVTAREKSGNIAMLRIERLDNIQNIQRRQFFRFDCTIPVNYRVIDKSNEPGKMTVPYNSSITKDLSGSGLCMLVEEKLDEHAQLDCELYLEPDLRINFTGKIIRISKCDFESKYKYEIGLTYKSIDNKDREAIVKYIFNEQRRLRKKGLI